MRLQMAGSALAPCQAMAFSKVNHAAGETYYSVLNVAPEAKDSTISQAFQKESLYTHPQWEGVANAERFKAVNEAYYHLKDDGKR